MTILIRIILMMCQQHTTRKYYTTQIHYVNRYVYNNINTDGDVFKYLLHDPVMSGFFSIQTVCFT